MLDVRIENDSELGNLYCQYRWLQRKKERKKEREKKKERNKERERERERELEIDNSKIVTFVGGGALLVCGGGAWLVLICFAWGIPELMLSPARFLRVLKKGWVGN